MEVPIKIQKISEATTKSGNPYLEITDTENHTHRLFDMGKRELCKPGANIILVKEKKGNFWNVIDVKEGKEEEKTSPTYRGKSSEELELSKLSYCMSYMKDIVCQGEEAVELLYISERPAVVGLRRQLEMGLGQGFSVAPPQKSAEPITPEQEVMLRSFPQNRLKELLKERGITKPTKAQANSLIDQLEMEWELDEH